MKKQGKLQVLQRGTRVTEIRSEEVLQEVVGGVSVKLPPKLPGIGCGGPNECLA